MSDDLTAREKQAASFVCAGMSNREVALQMSLKESTVKQYLYRVYDKIGVINRGQLASHLSGQRESPK